MKATKHYRHLLLWTRFCNTVDCFFVLGAKWCTHVLSLVKSGQKLRFVMMKYHKTLNWNIFKTLIFFIVTKRGTHQPHGLRIINFLVNMWCIENCLMYMTCKFRHFQLIVIQYHFLHSLIHTSTGRSLGSNDSLSTLHPNVL